MTALRVLSLGAGRQSTALLVMSGEGVLPKLDHAIFSDTGWEHPEVYAHLAALTRWAGERGITVHQAKHGDLRDDVLDPDKFATIPAWTKAPDGKSGRIIRQCTPKYKVEPLERKLRTLVGAPVWDTPCRYCDATGRRYAPWRVKAWNLTPGQEPVPDGPCSVCGGSGMQHRVGSVPDGAEVEQWIGFSADEFERATSVGFPSYTTVRHPLIELGWTAGDCVRWLAEHGWKGVTTSSCVGCPFHDDDTWLDMADKQPDLFAEQVEFDALIRFADGLTGLRYLHESRLPLDQAVERYRVLKASWGEQGVLWDEYRAKRKVRRCNPFGCRAEEIEEAV